MRARSAEALFILGCLVAGVASVPQDWTLLVGLALPIALSAALGGRWPTLGQVLLCLACMPVWVAAGASLGGAAWVLGGVSLILVVLVWPDISQRRVGGLLLLLATVESGRAWLLGGAAALPVAIGLFLYGLMGAGIWGGCARRRAGLIGGLLVLFISSGRVLWTVVQGDQASLSERVAWGLDIGEQEMSSPDEGLDLIREGYQTPRLVQGLLNHFSIEELMEVGLDPRVDQLTVADVIRSAKWLERAGQGGRALRLLVEARADSEACWWAHLFARTQRQDLVECSATPPEEAWILGATPSIIAWPDDVADLLQIELEIVETVSYLELGSEEGLESVELSVDHGPWQAGDSRDGWTRISGPFEHGAHRVQIRTDGDSNRLGEVSLRTP